MIEAYAFFAAFTVQIVAFSILLPVLLGGSLRAQVANTPADRFAQLYPGVDFSWILERYLTVFRVLSTIFAVLGFLLLGWLFDYMRHPQWDGDKVVALTVVYSMLQMSPLLLHAWIGIRHKAKLLKHSLPEGKRKASLHRRGLFDFVSPFIVFLAALSYLLFVAYVIYIAQDPYPGFGGYANIFFLTLVYALEGFVVYRTLYGKKINAVETHASNVHILALGVRVCVYACIISAVYFSLSLTLKQFALMTWAPFTQSVFFVTCAFCCLLGFAARPRQPEADGFGGSPSSL